MTITAQDVKKLRDATGAGMLDSKNALVEADGDFDKAIEVLRVKGRSKVEKRGAERTASAGLVANSGGALVELNSETDFVAKSDAFIALATEIAAAAEQAKAPDAETLKAVTLPSQTTVADAIEALASRHWREDRARQGHLLRRQCGDLHAPPVERPAARGRRTRRVRG